MEAAEQNLDFLSFQSFERIFFIFKFSYSNSKLNDPKKENIESMEKMKTRREWNKTVSLNITLKWVYALLNKHMCVLRIKTKQNKKRK